MISHREMIRRYQRWAEDFLRQLNSDLALKGHVRKRALQGTVDFYASLLAEKDGSGFWAGTGRGTNHDGRS